MRLQIRRIFLTNWKCYRQQQISLHQDESKNISVVFGNNGFGKTSLLEAVRWCLYGSDALREVLQRFNRVALEENPELELSVQMFVQQGDRMVEITRSAKRTMRGTIATATVSEPIVRLDGRDVRDPRAFIDDLLPFACSEFFFFDGVEIKRYAQSVHSEEMKDAIERILGIPELRNLREDSRRAMEQLDAQLNAVQVQSPELVRISSELQSREEDHVVLQGQIGHASAEHDAAISLFESLRIEAGAQEAIRGKLEDIERKSRQKDRLSADIAEAGLQIERALRQAPIPLLLEFIRENATDLQRQSLSSARRSASVSQIRALLESESCLCGRPIDEGARRHIEQMLQSAPVDTTTIEAIRADSDKAKLEMLARFHAPEIDVMLQRRDQLVTDYDGLLTEIARLKQETGDLPPGSANELWRRVGEAEANVKSRREELEGLRKSLVMLEMQIGALRRERETLAAQQTGTAQLAVQARLARNLFEAANELIDWRIEETRFTIEQETSRIHRAVTNKPEEYVGVEIADNFYSLRVRTAFGTLLDPETLSAGEKEALAFAFIAGLNIASGKSAPFVMDTPFGHLDMSHQRNLVQALPHLPSQVTILATDRDLPEPLLGSIRERIADELSISRVGSTEDASIISEVA